MREREYSSEHAYTRPYDLHLGIVRRYLYQFIYFISASDKFKTPGYIK
jgi:hypothetical protein